jgi:Tol biopolymer transport system component
VTRFIAILALALASNLAVADTPSAPTLSSDGRHEASVDSESDGGSLMIRNTQTGAVRAVLRLGGRNSHPVFSPDGLFVAFYATFRDTVVLTVSDLTGHSWPVAELREIVAAPSWSADAVHVFFADRAGGGSVEHFRVTAGGTDLTQVPR